MKLPLVFATAILLAACQHDTNTDLPAPGSVQHEIISAEAEAWLEQDDVPALAVAYIVDGKIAWTDVYGASGPGTPATQDTLFNIASMTKPITAETILRLASEGQASLEAPMSDVWTDPDIADDPRHLALTPELALRHRAGFPNWREGELAFKSNPDEKTAYSGEGYQYVARYAEELSGQAFPDLAEREVFAPLGITDATYIARPGDLPRIARPKGPDGSWGDPVQRTQFNAADDVLVTIGDYAKFLVGVMADEGISGDLAARRFQINDNLFASGCPWGPEACPVEGGFGLGWTVFRYENETVVMHGGGDWGERTIGFFVPERQVGVIVFTNGANGSRTISRVAEVLYPESDFLDFLAFQASR